MYGVDGRLNVDAMKSVLGQMDEAIGQLMPAGRKSAARQLIKGTVDKDLGDPKVAYGALKSLADKIKGDSRRPEMQRLGDAVLQMARVHNYQTGMRQYDHSGDLTALQLRKQNPSLDERANAASSQSRTVGGGGGAAFGLTAGAMTGPTAGVGLRGGASTSSTFVNDLDTDKLHISRNKAVGKLTTDAGVLSGWGGRVAGPRLGASVAGTLTKGALAEQEDLKGVVHAAYTHQREGGVIGDRKMAPSPATIKSQVNTSTRGLLPRASHTLRQAKAHLTGQAVDTQPQLNTHKLVKGADATSYLVGDQSVVKDVAQLQALQRSLDQHYGDLPQVPMPVGLKPLVGDGSWYEVEAKLSGNVLAGKAGVPGLQITGPGAAAEVGVSHRWLPYHPWAAPHSTIQTLADGNSESKRDIIRQIRSADPSLSAYLDKVSENGVERLQQDCSDFESHARKMLAARSTFLGKASSNELKAHAENVFSESRDALKSTFALSDDELRGVGPHDNGLEPFLARCWNRLSLGHAQASLGSHTPEQQATLNQLDKAIREPDVQLAPSHFYHKATIQQEATLKRLRAQGDFKITLPGVDAGIPNTSVQASMPSAGSLQGRVTYDNVSQHPNLVRNGEFLTFNTSAAHLPGLGALDKAARAVAEGIVNQIEPGVDQSTLSETQRADLIGDIATTLQVGDAATLTHSAGVMRANEVMLHRSDKAEPWRLAYVQGAHLVNHSAGVKGSASISAGVGGKVSAEAEYATENALVKPPILGSDPAIHILQYPVLQKELFDGASQYQEERVDLARLRVHDVAPMYFSNNAILDVLDQVQKLKQDRWAQADVLGQLAQKPFNSHQYEQFRSSGMEADALERQLAEARAVTQSMGMDERLQYFSTTSTGRELLREYATAMKALAAMKSRAFTGVSEDGHAALSFSILKPSGQKVPLSIAAGAGDVVRV